MFVPTLSAIAYAPVNGCRYNAAIDNINGDFLIDLDADGDLADETHGDIENEMQSLDLDGDTEVDDRNGNRIPDVIEDTGFRLPGSPENFSLQRRHADPGIRLAQMHQMGHDGRPTARLQSVPGSTEFSHGEQTQNV